MQLAEFMAQSQGQEENADSDIPLKDRLIEEESDQEEQLPEEIALKAIEGERAAKASKEEALTKEIQDFSSQNPEIAAQLIRTWLKGDENDG
jgi:flagellar M-ring protein FliF